MDCVWTCMACAYYASTLAVFSTAFQSHLHPLSNPLCFLQTFKHYFGTRQLGQTGVFFITFVQQLELNSPEGPINLSGKQPLFFFLLLLTFCSKIVPRTLCHSAESNGVERNSEQTVETTCHFLGKLASLEIKKTKKKKKPKNLSSFCFGLQPNQEWMGKHTTVCLLSPPPVWDFFSFEIFNGAERSAVAFPPVSRENATWATSSLTPTLNKSMFVRRLCPSADFHLARSPCVAARCRSHAGPAQ